VDAAGAACASITAVAIRRRDIIVQATRLVTAEVSGACASAAGRSTLLSPRLFSPRWRQPVSRAALKAVEQLESDHDGVLAQFRREVERAQYEVHRAERRYRAVDPENRLVARGLEAEWENSLRQLALNRK
jgi:hypothetical protein